MRKFVILLVISILFTPLLPTSATLGHFQLADAYWTGPIVFGGVNTFVVEVVNRHSGTVTSISGTLTIYDLAGTDVTDTYSYPGSSFPGQTLQLPFDFVVPVDARASHYKAKLRIDYTLDGSPRSEVIDLLVTVRGDPEVRCYLLATARPGETIEVEIALRNEGDGVARDVRATFLPSPVASVSSPLVFGMMNPGEELRRVVTVYVGRADEAVTLRVSVTWFTQTGSPGEFTCQRIIAIEEVPASRFSVRSNVTELDPGVENHVALLVRNEGPEQVYRVSVSAGPILGAAVEGPSKAYIGTMAPNETFRLNLTILVDPLSQGPLQVPVTVEWYDSGSEKHAETFNLGFFVRGGAGPYFVAFADRAAVRPGVEEALDIMIFNEGEETAESVRVDFLPSNEIAILSASGVELGDVRPGEGRRITILASASNVTFGTVSLSLRVSYRDARGITRSQIIPVSFKVEPPESPIITLAPLDLELEVDNVDELRLKIENMGGLARDIVVKVAPVSPEIGSVVGEDLIYIESLRQGESFEGKLKIYLSPKAYGAVQFIAQVSYEDESGFRRSSVLSFGVRAVGRPEIEVMQVFTIPSPIYPGDEGVRLVVVVTNVGNYLAEDLRLTLEPPVDVIRPSALGTDTFLIPVLPPGGVANATFKIDVSEEASPGRYEVPLLWDGGNTTVPIEIDKKAVFRLIKFEIPGSPRPGDRGVRLVMVIANEGGETAEDIVVEVLTPYLVGTTTVALGDVPPGTNASAIMEVDIDEEAPTKIPVDLKIRWKHGNRQLYQTIYADVVIGERRKEIPLQLILLLVLLGIGLVMLLTHPTVRRRISKGS